MNRKIKKSMMEMVAKAAYKEAERNVNTSYTFIHGQPKMPESVKKLKKND